MFSFVHFILLLPIFLSSICPLVQGEHHSFDILSLTWVAPSTVNCSSSKDQYGNVSLGLFHRFSPCSGLPGNFSKPSIQEALLHDQLRLQTLVGSNVSGGIDSKKLIANLPDYKYGSSGGYVVVVGLGTPKVDQVLELDTGSPLTWVQCSSCSMCMTEVTPRFNPSLSSTYKVALCNQGICPLHGGDVIGCSQRSTCLYNVTYGDESYTTGELGSDVLTLSPTLQVTEFKFGCGLLQYHRDRNMSGLLGLARETISIVYQTFPFFHGVFSYCLPASERSSGHFTFGGLATASYTYVPMPIASMKLFYPLNLMGISVGGLRLKISESEFLTPAGSIIDSGTTLTSIPPRAYSALCQAFTGFMSRYNSGLNAVNISGLTCYNLKGLSQITVPLITLHVSGMPIELSKNGIFYEEGEDYACLAFQANQNPTTMPNIIGNVNQRQLEVVYDIPNSRIGFAKGTCV